MQDLSLASFVLEPEEVGEMGDCMGALARAAARAEEDLSPFLAPGPRCYLFGSLGAAACRLSMWLLPELHVSLALVRLTSPCIGIRYLHLLPSPPLPRSLLRVPQLVATYNPPSQWSSADVPVAAAMMPCGTSIPHPPYVACKS